MSVNAVNMGCLRLLRSSNHYRSILFVILLSLVVGCADGSSKKGGKEGESVKKIANQLVLTPTKDSTEYQTLHTIDLGTIHAGEIVSGGLNFTTSSDKPVIIYELKGSCGCTDIEGLFKEIKKGENKKITYLIRTADKIDEEYFDILISSSIGKFIVEIKANVKGNF